VVFPGGSCMRSIGDVDRRATRGGGPGDGVDDGKVAKAVLEGGHRRQSLDAGDLLEERASLVAEQVAGPNETPGKSIGRPPRMYGCAGPTRTWLKPSRPSSRSWRITESSAGRSISQRADPCWASTSSRANSRGRSRFGTPRRSRSPLRRSGR
jgi:hypothetical protein